MEARDCVIDQHQLHETGVISDTRSNGYQTITAGTTGNWTSLHIHYNCFPEIQSSYAIFEGEVRSQATKLLGFMPFTCDSYNYDLYGWRKLLFPRPVHVTEGEVYSFLIKSQGNPDVTGVIDNENDWYPGGHSSFQEHSDMLFKTCVVPDQEECHRSFCEENPNVCEQSVCDIESNTCRTLNLEDETICDDKDGYTGTCDDGECITGPLCIEEWCVSEKGLSCSELCESHNLQCNDLFPELSLDALSHFSPNCDGEISVPANNECFYPANMEQPTGDGDNINSICVGNANTTRIDCECKHPDARRLCYCEATQTHADFCYLFWTDYEGELVTGAPFVEDDLFACHRLCQEHSECEMWSSHPPSTCDACCFLFKGGAERITFTEEFILSGPKFCTGLNYMITGFSG